MFVHMENKKPSAENVVGLHSVYMGSGRLAVNPVAVNMCVKLRPVQSPRQRQARCAKHVPLVQTQTPDARKYDLLLFWSNLTSGNMIRGIYKTTRLFLNNVVGLCQIGLGNNPLVLSFWN
jgi:hypothetical protein